MNKAQHTTRGIKHWGLCGYANSISRIKVSCTLIVKCLRTPQRFHTAALLDDSAVWVPPAATMKSLFPQLIPPVNTF